MARILYYYTLMLAAFICGLYCASIHGYVAAFIGLVTVLISLVQMAAAIRERRNDSFDRFAI